jgi:predicted amidophosphoribosyltransferase
MTCTYCRKETSDILRKCQNCGNDLEEYNSNREKALEGTGFILFCYDFVRYSQMFFYKYHLLSTLNLLYTG